MSRENLNFFFASSNAVFKGEFVVARIKKTADVTQKMTNEDLEVVYEGDEDLSSLLLGFGIARKISTEDGRVLMMFHPEQDIKLPDNVTGVDGL